MKKKLLILFLMWIPFYGYTSELNIYTWAHYIPDSVLQKFTEKTGIKINYDNYDSNEILEAKILAGNAGYDLIFPSVRPTFDRLIKVNAIQKLDYTKIPNAKYLSEELTKMIYSVDPQNQHGIVYHWGTTGIGVNVKKVRALFPDEDLNDLSLLFKAENAKKLSQCKISILDSKIDFLPAAFHFLNIPDNTDNPEEINQVYKMLKSIRPYISNFDSATYLDKLINNEVCYATGYSGDILRVIKEAKNAGIETDVEYFIPKEGAQLSFDVIAIPNDAPNPENAYKFINFILEPQIIAEITNYILFANAIPASKPYLDDSLKNNPNVYPSQAIFKTLYFSKPLSPKQARLQNQLWTKFISNR